MQLIDSDYKQDVENILSDFFVDLALLNEGPLTAENVQDFIREWVDANFF